MKRKLYLLITCFWIGALMAAHAHPTMAGRLQSYDGSKGILKLELEDKSVRTFAITSETTCEWMGRNTAIGSLRPGVKISIQIKGSLGNNPLKALKVVDWNNSETIVAKGAIAPEYTPVGQYASTNGTGGVPDGAPVGNHAPNQTLAAVGHGGSINNATPGNLPVNNGPSNDGGQSSMGQSSSPAFYQNQGQSMTAPLEMMQMSPYGTNPQMGMDPQAGMNPQMGGNPAMNPGMDPSMMGMDPSLGMSNPYSQTNLGQGQSGSLMGMDDGSGDYSTGGDMMGLNSGAYGSGDGKITGRILQADLRRGFLMVQSMTNPQPQRILLGMSSSAPTNLLVPGQMVDITGQNTANGFQATDIQAAAGY